MSGHTQDFRIALPINENRLGFTKTVWQTPSTIVVMSKKTKKKYHTLLRGAGDLYFQSFLNSFIITVV